MSNIRFGTPPQSSRASNYDWSTVAEQLRANPGEWAEVFADDRYSLVTSMSSGAVVAFRVSPTMQVRDPQFEYRTTNNYVDQDGRRRCDLWMRFVPAKKKGRKS